MEGTKTIGIFLSSHKIGRWATTSGGWTSSATTTSLAVPRSTAFVVSLVPFLTFPVLDACLRTSYAASETSFGVSNFTKYRLRGH